jgi:tripartite-type tricarboxylate transporter receptor subunit TctC
MCFSIVLPALAGHAAWSQTRTIKIVVPFGPDTSIDILARLLAEQIGRAQGLIPVIENRPGAGSIIATEAVAGAPHDGNTVLLVGNTLVINPHLRKVNYNPLTSFEPICYLVDTQQFIVVNGASPYRTLADLLNSARDKPGDLTMAMAGPGTGGHIGFEELKQAANVNMTFVPYQGTPPAINALLGAHVTSVLVDYAVLAELLHTGKLRALATASRTRFEMLPNVPTVAESGYKDYEMNIWFGVVAPAKTPKEAVAQLADGFVAAMQIPETKRKLVAQGLFPVGMCGADFSTFIRKQYDDYGRVIRETNIKVE